MGFNGFFSWVFFMLVSWEIRGTAWNMNGKSPLEFHWIERVNKKLMMGTVRVQ